MDVNARVLCCVVVCSMNDLARHVCVCIDCPHERACLRDVFCAGRVTDEDMKRTMKACGGSVQTSVEDLTAGVLGTCEVFEEKQVGSER